MNIEVYPTYQDISKRAKDILVDTIKAKKASVLGLATGSTPIGLYASLVEAYQKDEVSFNNVITYNLDEYIGIAQNHPQSYYHFMHEHLFKHIDIKNDNIHMPSNDKNALSTIANDYTKALDKNTIDLQILGLGKNGHIGFNEPGTPFDQETFIVELDAQTREDNSRFFDSIEEVPTHAITMGIKNIMHAKHIVLIASGKEKAEAVFTMIKGPVTQDFPASILQLHPHCTILLDADAASQL